MLKSKLLSSMSFHKSSRASDAESDLFIHTSQVYSDFVRCFSNFLGVFLIFVGRFPIFLGELLAFLRREIPLLGSFLHFRCEESPIHAVFHAKNSHFLDFQWLRGCDNHPRLSGSLRGRVKNVSFFGWVFLNLSRLLCPTCSCRCDGGNRKMLAFCHHLLFMITLSTKKSLMASLECDEGLMNIAHKGDEGGRAYHSSCSATVVFIYCNVRRSRWLLIGDEVLALLLRWQSWKAHD